MCKRFQWTLLMLAFAIWGLLNPALIGQDQLGQATSAATFATPNLDDSRDIAAFIDGIIHCQIENAHFAGATVAVVREDQIVFSKGYGAANIERDISVNSATTMFRIGSVSKLFVWTAVMQLVEDQEIDLDEDLNRYLADVDLKIPEAFDQPITMNHLMAHAPGFEDYVVGLFGETHDVIRPIAEIMREQMPRRVRPPGDLASYSNHGTLLAALVIEQVSGMTWETFVDQRILQPLKMQHTMLRQPPPEDVPDDLSLGYSYTASTDQLDPGDFEYIPAAPAGCIAASADDMARFMIAHLNSGQYQDRAIMKPETIDLMQTRSHWHDERLDGMCHGFWEQHINGVRTLQHGGDTDLFHSLLVIIPQQKVGLFVSYNTDSAGSSRNELLTAFMNRYFPTEKQPRTPPDDFSQRSGAFVGSYKMLRYDHSTPAKLMMALQVLPVKAGENDRLLIGGKSYVEVEPFLFAEENGSEKIAFRASDAGKITHLFVNRAPPIAFEKMPWYETPGFNLGLFSFSILVLMAAILGWPLVHLATKGEWIAGGEPTRTSRLISWMGWLSALAIIVYLIVFAIQAEELVHRFPPTLDAMLTASPLIGVIAVILFGLAVLAWVRGFWRMSGRVHYTLVALVAIALTWQLSQFNFVRWPV